MTLILDCPNIPVGTMVLKSVSQHRFFRPAMGAVLTVLCGLALWGAPLGDRWVNASYDWLYRFSTKSVTNSLVLIRMDNESFQKLDQKIGQPWDRHQHARLLNKLADDGCRLVVLDIVFDQMREPEMDNELAAALARQKVAVLAADQLSGERTDLDSAEPIRPALLFEQAVRTNWGIGKLQTNADSVVRHHWPFPSPDYQPDLAWVAAQCAGAHISTNPVKRWLRYYGPHGAWSNVSYYAALAMPSNSFHDKIVFVGAIPGCPIPGAEQDIYSTPYSAWPGGQRVGGVEILATSFLNLVNSDWLRRPDSRLEAILILAFGLILGGGLCQVRLGAAIGIAIAIFVALLVSATCLSYFTNYWFPWLVIAAGTVPCALGWNFAANHIRSKISAPVQPEAESASTVAEAVPVPVRVAVDDEVEKAEAIAKDPDPRKTIRLSFSGWDTVLAGAQGVDSPEAPDYEVFAPPFGEGGFGKVWLARNAIGQWQALKAVYQSKFGQRTGPYEAEFKGIKRYKPISDKHPGLLRVDFVSKKKEEGYFYYVMELGDAQQTGWEEDPSKYKPRDLANARAKSPEGRLPVSDCAQIVLVLAEALEFLHGQGLTHRDIKPSNIIFVNGRPKLTDVGLVTDVRPPEEVTTFAGSPGYMPPHPEPPGTIQADIYGLGMVLFVISTGRDPAPFSSLSSSLLERKDQAQFLKLSNIILKACQPDCALRYKSATDLRADLLQVTKTLEPI
jgi:CHASE2 domain-containing sensor protein